jgi:hypothetical protein
MGINGLQAPLVVVPHADGMGHADAGSDAQGRLMVGTACVDPVVARSATAARPSPSSVFAHASRSRRASGLRSRARRRMPTHPPCRSSAVAW